MRGLIDDTIAAVSTPPGQGGIAIVRLSGPEAFPLCQKIFQPNKTRPIRSHTIHYGHIVENGISIDEVLVSFMRAPHTYTAQDIAEINCHGGFTAAPKILSMLLREGARSAEPGEFTMRAFLNGRIDLSQAEAVMELVGSSTDWARQNAVRHLSGSLSQRIIQLRERILLLQAGMEAAIDYPEYEYETLDRAQILKEILSEIRNLIASAQRGRILTQGISMAIIGRPNVGKSSLLNALLKQDRAIVSDIPGTTRDILTETIQFGHMPLRLMDTAGLREADGSIEQLGVDKARACAQSADVICWVLDGSAEWADGDIFEMIRGKKIIGVVNKSDLPVKLPPEWLRDSFQDIPFVFLSAKEMTGLPELEDALEQLFLDGEIGINDTETVTNLRHLHALENAEKSIQSVLQGISENVTDDLLSLDIAEAYAELGQILGLEAGDDLIEKIFSTFCVGK